MAALVLAVAIGGDRHPHRVLGAVVFLVTAGTLVWGPLVATGSRRRGAPLAAAIGVAAMLLLPAAFTGAGAGAALSAGIASAGFFLLLCGITATLDGLTGKSSVAIALAGLLGALLLATFHVGDPLIEWPGPGRGSAVALRVLHVVNPLSGAIGHALDVDWLRLPIMYSGFPGSTTGGLSAAQYYYWQYFPWWGTALLHGGPGLFLLAGVRHLHRLRWRRIG